MKVYISGKITGLQIEEVNENFSKAASYIRSIGHIPISPLDITPPNADMDWKEFMIKDISGLLDCDAIYMLKNWGQSKGARIEYQIAKEMDLKIIFE